MRYKRRKRWYLFSCQVVHSGGFDDGGGNSTRGLFNQGPCHSSLHPLERILREGIVVYACVFVCALYGPLVPHHISVCRQSHTDSPANYTPSGRGVRTD